MAKCFACKSNRSSDELGECLICGAKICGLGGCTGECKCDVVKAPYRVKMKKGSRSADKPN